MKIKLLKAIVIKGHPGVSVGDVFDVADSIGADLCVEGAAELVKAEPTRTIEVREPEVESRDPQPTPKKRR